MERLADDERRDASDGEEFPAGTEAPAEPPGVPDEADEEEQPGLSDDPPQVD